VRQRMKFLSPVFALLLLAVPAAADTLKGFRVETLGTVSGFVSSVVVDSKDNVYFTTTDGWIHRLDGTGSVRVASLPTKSGGNSGLLGMALLDDRTAVVHYTTWSGEKVLDDVIATVDLVSGAEKVMSVFQADIRNRENGSSSEHHGGNPTVAPDGTIYIGIGEYGGRVAAQRPDWNGGKIFRIDRTGHATQYALGMRNPYDLAWDPDLQRVVVADNGPDGGDEIHVIEQGSNCGWPDTYGNQPQISGGVAPDYVFTNTVAPTGLARLTGANDLLRRGYLVAAFVTKAIYYFPDLGTRPVADPIPLVEGFDQFVIDVTQSAKGEIYFATAMFPGSTSIHRLTAPERGDCNGDASINYMDALALMSELNEAPSQHMTNVQNDAHSGSWGCDVTGDGLVDAQDLQKLTSRLMKKRAVRR
jgi:glucose/arabinose dehydrogenase